MVFVKFRNTTLLHPGPPHGTGAVVGGTVVGAVAGGRPEGPCGPHGPGGPKMGTLSRKFCHFWQSLCIARFFFQFWQSIKFAKIGKTCLPNSHCPRKEGRDKCFHYHMAIEIFGGYCSLPLLQFPVNKPLANVQMC